MKKILLLIAFLILATTTYSQTYYKINGNYLQLSPNKTDTAWYILDSNNLKILTSADSIYLGNTVLVKRNLYVDSTINRLFINAYPNKKDIFIGSYIPVNIDTSTYANNLTIIGFHAGDSITSADAITLIGAYAGQKLKGDVNGYYNTFIGNWAGQNCVEAYNNVAIGDSALNAGGNSYSNVALGTYALKNTTGSNNIGIGVSAGERNTTGQSNIFIGFGAGRNNTTAGSGLFVHSYGINNTSIADDSTFSIIYGFQSPKPNNNQQRLWFNARTFFRFNLDIRSNRILYNDTNLIYAKKTSVYIGHNAGIATATGTGNFVYGSGSGDAMTTASNNILIGQNSGSAFTSSGDNIAIGVNTLAINNNVRNVSIGAFTGANNSSGTLNTYLGTLSGNVNAGSNNVFLGSFSGAYLTNFSNKLILNSLNRTNIAGDTTNSIIYGNQNASSALQQLYFNSKTYFKHNLDVKGNSILSNDTLALKWVRGGIKAGYLAGGSTETGLYNTAIGYESGTLLTSATGCNFIGYRTGKVNTGNYNTFIGNNAGANNTTGTENTFVAAGRDNSTGSYNTMMGSAAGLNSNGDGNSIFGAYAGTYLSAGTYNVLLGYKCGTISNGSYNVLAGYEAGYATTGNYNVNMGYRAGKGITTGTSNLCLGSATGGAIAKGIGNSLIGVASGINVSGNYNLFLGAYSGYNLTSYNKRLVISSTGLQQTGIAGDTTQSIIYGVMYQDSSKYQKLYFNSNVTIKHGEINTPSAIDSITAAGGIPASLLTKKVIRLFGESGAVDISADPQIADGIDGQIIELWGKSETNTVKLDDSDGLQLAGGTSFTLGLGDVIVLRYFSDVDLWIEISRSDN